MGSINASRRWTGNINTSRNGWEPFADDGREPSLTEDGHEPFTEDGWEDGGQEEFTGVTAILM